MEQPPGYVAQGENKVCHLKKAIYGLKKSLGAWRSSVLSFQYWLSMMSFCLRSAHKF